MQLAEKNEFGSKLKNFMQFLQYKFLHVHLFIKKKWKSASPNRIVSPLRVASQHLCV